MCNECILIGDFNLDAMRDLSNDNNYKQPLEALNNFVLECNLFQNVNYPTWSLTINGIVKESLLDHIYVKNVTTIFETSFDIPTFGAHAIVMATLNYQCKIPTSIAPIQRRSWKDYSSLVLNELLSIFDALTVLSLNENCNVQEMWNILENWITKACDACAPLVNCSPQVGQKKVVIIPPVIKNKINKRKRLLRIQKSNFSMENCASIRLLNL